MLSRNGVRKWLKVAWAVIAVSWSAFCLFFAYLGAAMSVSDPHFDLAFLLYWLVPVAAPGLLFLMIPPKESDADQFPG